MYLGRLMGVGGVDPRGEEEGLKSLEKGETLVRLIRHLKTYVVKTRPFSALVYNVIKECGRG